MSYMYICCYRYFLFEGMYAYTLLFCFVFFFSQFSNKRLLLVGWTLKESRQLNQKGIETCQYREINNMINGYFVSLHAIFSLCFSIFLYLHLFFQFINNKFLVSSMPGTLLYTLDTEMKETSSLSLRYLSVVVVTDTKTHDYIKSSLKVVDRFCIFKWNDM